jgi:predicted phosphodiesterase
MRSSVIARVTDVVSSVAVLSDVHGVLPVLDAVLAEPDVAAADLIVVTGDPELMWAAGQLRGDQVRLLSELPHPVVLDVDGFGPVVFCHGTPRDDEEMVLVDTRLEKWAEVFVDLPAEI